MRLLLTATLAAVALTASAQGIESLDVDSTVLHAARVLDVAAGKIISPGEILVIGDRIREVGPQVKHPTGAIVIDLGDTTLMPGLIDAHVHLFLHPGAEDLQTVQESVPERVLSAAAAERTRSGTDSWTV